MDETLADLESAEDFLDHFGIAYDARVVQVNRLHILQRFHDYLAEAAFMDLQDREHNTRDGLHIASLAGAWTDTGWPATMEGAVRSGLAAARAVLGARGPARAEVAA